MKPVELIIKHLFGKYLLVTNTVTSSVLMATGDFIQQSWTLSKEHEKIDWQRTSHMMGVGFCLGPFQHLFYKFIDEKYPSRNLKSVIKKVIIDQSVCSPVFIAVFFISSALIENEINSCLVELKKKFWKIYLIDCLVWPPVQFLNFFYFNPRYRMLYVNLTTMMYDIFLSYIKHQDKRIQ